MMQNLIYILTSFGLIDILLNISLFITQECVNGTYGYDCVKNVAVTVFTTLHVTNRLVSVTGGVIQDILTPIAAEVRKKQHRFFI